MKTINDRILSILIIDDDRFSNLFSEHMLRNMIHYTGDLKICLNGELAIDYLKETIKSRKRPLPDIIFLDINMPVMNGFEFIEAYQEIKIILNKEIFIYMLTSSLSKWDREMAKKHKELRGFLSKPIDEGTLSNLMHEMCGH